MTIDIPDILAQAADLIDEHGLAKERFRNSDGGYCARGAIFQALDWTPGVFHSAEAAASQAVANYMNLPVQPVSWVPETDGRVRLARWNNDPRRTPEEVTSALRETAASIRLGETEVPEPEPDLLTWTAPPRSYTFTTDKISVSLLDDLSTSLITTRDVRKLVTLTPA